MSNLIPGLIPLEHGLNLQTAKIAAPPGSSLDMLNYEQVDFVGQKRIDGYVRYDGNMEPVLDEYLVLTLEEPLPGSPGDLLYVSGEFWGRLLEASGTEIYVAVYNHKLTPDVAGSITWDDGSYEVSAITKGKDVEGVTAEEHYNNLLRFMNVLRGEIGELPPVAGLHWHDDRLYAVADVLALVINTAQPPAMVELCAGVGEGGPMILHVDNHPDGIIPEYIQLTDRDYQECRTFYRDIYDPYQYKWEFAEWVDPDCADYFGLEAGKVYEVYFVNEGITADAVVVGTSAADILIDSTYGDSIRIWSEEIWIEGGATVTVTGSSGTYTGVLGPPPAGGPSYGIAWDDGSPSVEGPVTVVITSTETSSTYEICGAVRFPVDD